MSRCRSSARSGRPTWSARRDRGAVTAELAAALPVLVLLLAAGLTSISAVATQLRCLGAARDAALAQARGDDGAAVARATAPENARIAVVTTGEAVEVVVTADVHPFGGRLPAVTVRARAVAAVEPGAP